MSIKKIVDKCELIKKYGETGTDKGKCLGFDKSIKKEIAHDNCVKCSAYIGYKK